MNINIYIYIYIYPIAFGLPATVPFQSLRETKDTWAMEDVKPRICERRNPGIKSRVELLISPISRIARKPLTPRRIALPSFVL